MDTESLSPTRDQLAEERHATLYLPDGDIVISAPKAKDPSTLVLFRLDTLVLRCHSSIFKDMLSLPGDRSTNEQYDGVSRVRLTDDADDLAGLFKAMNNPASLPLKRCHPDTVLEVTGIMRLAVKYDVQAVQSLIVNHISADWTCTLIEWEKRRVVGTELDCALGRSYTSQHFIAHSLPEPASAVRFAMEFDVPDILPLAMYELAFTPRSYTWDMCNEQGLSTLAGDAFDKKHVVNHRFARWELLELPGVHAVLRGKEAVSSHWRHILANFDVELPDDYCSGVGCAEYLSSACRFIHENSLPEVALEWNPAAWTHEHVPDDPLTLARLLCKQLESFELCSDCAEECQDRLRDWANSTWANLRNTFRIV